MIDVRMLPTALSLTSGVSSFSKQQNFDTGLSFDQLLSQAKTNIGDFGGQKPIFSLPEFLSNKAAQHENKALYSLGDHVPGVSMDIYKADDYQEHSPTYVAKGNSNGKDYEVKLNANCVNPYIANEIEITALLTHFREKGMIDEVLSAKGAFGDDDDDDGDDYSLFAKMNYSRLFSDWYSNSLEKREQSLDQVRNLGKIVSLLR
jgi:hypothetical protein